jgi:SWI/SNF-related matrix-associated actin-dependent regulator 1 of chromatin subfamily A
VEQIYQAFAPIAVRYDGTLSAQAKEQAKDRFQTDPTVRLFIGSIKAAGIGLTLTAASHVAFVELPWTASDLDQCTDRLHRIGQAATSVNIYYLLATDTIEEHVATIVDGKRTTFDAVMDGRATSESSMISALIAIYETQI